MSSSSSLFVIKLPMLPGCRDREQNALCCVHSTLLYHCVVFTVPSCITVLCLQYPVVSLCCVYSTLLYHCVVLTVPYCIPGLCLQYPTVSLSCVYSTPPYLCLVGPTHLTSASEHCHTHYCFGQPTFLQTCLHHNSDPEL
ncbi:hypothetical protein BsWGS_28785 [Bradybaena similaris]